MTTMLETPTLAASPAVDPYEREAQTLPHLAGERMSRPSAFGVEKTPANGKLPFERGGRNSGFFLIVDGAVEIFDRDERRRPDVLVAPGERRHTGELNLCNERASPVSEDPVVISDIHRFLEARS